MLMTVGRFRDEIEAHLFHRRITEDLIRLHLAPTSPTILRYHLVNTEGEAFFVIQTDVCGDPGRISAVVADQIRILPGLFIAEEVRFDPIVPVLLQNPCTRIHLLNSSDATNLDQMKTNAYPSAKGRGVGCHAEMPVTGRRPLPKELVWELSVCVQELHKRSKYIPLLLVGGPFSVYVRQHYHRVEAAANATKLMTVGRFRDEREAFEFRPLITEELVRLRLAPTSPTILRYHRENTEGDGSDFLFQTEVCGNPEQICTVVADQIRVFSKLSRRAEIRFDRMPTCAPLVPLGGPYSAYVRPHYMPLDGPYSAYVRQHYHRVEVAANATKLMTVGYFRDEREAYVFFERITKELDRLNLTPMPANELSYNFGNFVYGFVIQTEVCGDTERIRAVVADQIRILPGLFTTTVIGFRHTAK